MRIGREDSGSGGNKVGAVDEVVVEAREDPSQRDLGIPRDEQGFVDSRVWDPGSRTAGEQ